MPRTQLRSGLREDHADGNGEFRGHQDEEHQALPPERATTGFIAQFIQIGKRLGRFRTRVVGVVDDEAARGEAMVPQEDAHTGPQELVPRHLAVSKHPRQAAIAYVPRLARAKRAQQIELVTSTAVLQNASQVRCVMDSA